MSNLQKRTVTFVSWSNLVQDLDDDFCVAASSGIGDSVTWGDARHTLILARDILANLELDYEDGESGIAFKQRLESLGDDCYIDMET
jgi:hypothetical protein